MNCPNCGSKKSKIIRTVFVKKFSYVRRRRDCENGHRFTTREVLTAVVVNLENKSKQLDILKYGILTSLNAMGLGDQEVFEQELNRLTLINKRK